MGRSGHNQNKPFAFALFSLAEVAPLCNLFIIQIRCRDPWNWIGFSEKDRHPKFVNRKWQMEKNQKEQVHAVSNTTEGSRKHRLAQSPFPVSAN